MQVYKDTLHYSYQHAVNTPYEQIKLAFTAFDEKLQNLYERILESMADKVIRRFNL